MKLTYQRETTPALTYAEIKPGECFIDYDARGQGRPDVRIKTDEGCCVNISNGTRLASSPRNRKVIRVEVTAAVKY